MNERIIFAGTPDFAACHLQALLEAKVNIVAVYTQPDRPAGRGHKLTPSPVKAVALEHNLPVFTPLNFKDEADIQAWKDQNADLAIVVAYGLILPQDVLDAPRLGCINVHASLLPEWRGAAPIQRALLSGQKETGVTIMQIVKALDAGDILCTETLPILDTDTSGSLFERLASCGAASLVKHLPSILNEEVQPQPQDPTKVTYAAKLSREESPLNFADNANINALKIRGLNPWPVATTSLDNVTYKIFEGHAVDLGDPACAHFDTSVAPGTLLGHDATGLYVKCSESVLCITTIQAPGKGRVKAADLARSKPDVFAGGKSFE